MPTGWPFLSEMDTAGEEAKVQVGPDLWEQSGAKSILESCLDSKSVPDHRPQDPDEKPNGDLRVWFSSQGYPGHESTHSWHFS